jgi:iron complex outermembrane receptor protein
MGKIMISKKRLISLAVAASLLPASAVADGLIEEVVVTAEKRAQNLQEVPVAVTALSAENIEKLRIQELGDVAAKTPNFVIGQQSPTQPELTIRGIGSSDREAGSERSVVVFVDEVYVGRAGASTFNLFDLERIEVLRGPQGTLYGRNVVGGAINLISAKPSQEFGGKLQVTAGSDSLIEARGLVTGGLSDSLAGKLSFSTKQRDGFYYNARFDKDSNDLQSYSLRSQLMFEPSESLRALLTVELSRDEIDGVGSRITQGQASDADFAAALAPFGAYVPSADLYTVENNKFGEIERESFAIYSRIDWTLANDNIVTFIPAFRSNSLDELRDIAGIPFVGEGTTSRGFESSAINDEEYDATSFELRYASGDTASSLQWVTGLYYLSEEIARDQIRERQANTAFSRPLFDQNIDSSSMAIFGQVSWDINESFTLTAGIRYTDDEKDFDMAVINTLSAAQQAEIEARLGRATSLNPASEAYLASTTESWDEVTHKLTLDWQVNDDVLLYITSSSGYKSGGFSGLAATQTLAELAFNQETVDNLEAGIKATLFEDRFQLNLTAFQMDFEDLQLRDRQLLVPGDPTTAVVTIVNAGEAEINGVEAEFIVALTENLQITGNLASLDTEIVSVEEGSTLQQGTELPRSPGSSYSIGIDYSVPLSNGELNFRTDYRYTGSFFFDINEQAAGEEASYGIWDARIEYVAGEGDWSLAVWGKNLGDEEYRSHAQSIRAGRSAISQIGDPATYGATFTYNF